MFGIIYDLPTSTHVDFGFDFVTFKSTNPDGGIDSQRSEVRTLALSFGLRI